MDDLGPMLATLVADEPPLTLSPAPVVAAGRRARRVRRIAYGAGGLAATVAAVAVAAPLVGGSSPVSRVVPVASAPPWRQAVPADVPAESRALAQAIIDASPAGYRFDMSADRWSRGGVDATADDGTGAARLLVIVWDDVKPARPCADPLLAAEGPCTERATPYGLLSIQEGRDGSLGRPTVRATVSRPDGSGVIVEATSYLLTWPMPKVETEADKRALFQPARNRPAYTPDQAAEVALAVARATAPAGR